MNEFRQLVERFLESSRQPVLIEPGEAPFPLTPGLYHLEQRAGKLRIQVWDDSRTLSRKVCGLAESRPGHLILRTERFGGREGSIELVDTARPQSLPATRRASRLTYRERFRHSLSRQFPGWRIAGISSDVDLSRSLSPAYPRALIVKGTLGWAAIGAPPDQHDPSAALSFGLIWLAHLRRREPKLTVQGLALFFPEEWERSTCFRLRYLNPAQAQYRVYAYSDTQELLVDPLDVGNLDTRLPACNQRLEGPVDAMVRLLSEEPGVETVELGDGTASLRVRGLEFARASSAELRYGLESRRAAAGADLPEIAAIAGQLARMRHPRAADRHNELRTRNPELWLESEVRRAIEIIDPSLRPAPIYSQAPTFASAERGIIDLLAVDNRGRLAVLELKASEDLHLPVQALDYWMRVKWHLDRNEFSGRGFFPGIEVRPEPPRLILVAPALQFHPSTETILSFLSSDVEVVRIGLSESWRERLQVVFRLTGAESRA